MQPLNTLILIEYEEPKEKKTEAGLFVPPSASTVTAKDFLKSGKVLEVNAEETIIKKDDIVLFNIHSIVKVPQTENHYLIRKEDLYAVK